jgi:hypothetical protein
MLANNQLLNTIFRTIWIAVRFIVFGVGGFVLLTVCWLALLLRVLEQPDNFLSPRLAIPLILLAAFMILFGVGEWGRWAYLWVFLSTPLAVSVLLLLHQPNWGGKDLGVLRFCAPLVVSYFLVRRYYRERDAQKPSASSR